VVRGWFVDNGIPFSDIAARRAGSSRIPGALARTAGRHALPAVFVRAGIARAASAVLLLLTVLATAGCVGQLSLDAEEEVSPGAAIGFTSINYISQSREGIFRQRILDIDANGRSTLVTFVGNEGTFREPFRFLPQDRLLEVRRNFAESNFFFWADSVYGVLGDSLRLTQSIVFEDDGQVDQLIRYDEAPVPQEIGLLIEQLEELLEEGVYGTGDSTSVEEIFAGESTRIDRRQFVVVKSRDALLDLLYRIGSIEISVLPTIDYEREMLACVFLGEEAGATLSIVPRSAYRDANRVQLLYERRDAQEGCDLDARPYLLARLPRADVPVEFFEAFERDSTRCGLE